MESIFNEEDVVYTYSDKQAVDDGVLVDTSAMSKLFNRITSNLMNKGYYEEELKAGKKEMRLVNLKDLFVQARSLMKNKDYFFSGQIELPIGSKQKILIVANEVNGFTLMLPEDY